MRSYDNDRLHKLAKNILIGMELVDKRVDSIKKANVKKELNEEETRQAVAETNAFFADRKMQRKLEALEVRPPIVLPSRYMTRNMLQRVR